MFTAWKNGTYVVQASCSFFIGLLPESSALERSNTTALKSEFKKRVPSDPNFVNKARVGVKCETWFLYKDQIEGFLLHVDSPAWKQCYLSISQVGELNEAWALFYFKNKSLELLAIQKLQYLLRDEP
ncbi:unnamed protein product [Strongylus vulgaris]|uniref:Uncharacterized protein n=1 Tax=Strongylus vulgaris TaxID=40348 RepID=A0A3P7L8T1_STRVU|nr:unnamed protein product [Strongylus vulgaris]